MSASIWGESLTILENAAILKELVEKYGVESEGGKNLDLCEDAMLLPTIFDEPTQLIVQRLRVFGDFFFLQIRRTISLLILKKMMKIPVMNY